MSLIFNSNRIVEKNYKEKRYFSDRQPGVFKVKCYSCLLAFMVMLFGLNIYISLSQLPVMEMMHSFF